MPDDVWDAGFAPFTPEAADWLGAQGVRLVGTDAPSVDEATRCIIDCSGRTHGPPLPAQPGPDPMMIRIPRRSASRTACANSSQPFGKWLEYPFTVGMPTASDAHIASSWYFQYGP